MNRFRLSRRAEADIAEIRQYIAQDNATAADKLVGEFFDLFHSLARAPDIGEQRPDLRPNLRAISHGTYVVFYYPAENGPEIVGVIHGARDIDTMFREGTR
jgi:toxin ParE1/3/4